MWKTQIVPPGLGGCIVALLSVVARDDLTIDLVKAMAPTENMDPAVILDEWINRAQNLPEEIRFLQEEIAEKDRLYDKLLKEIEDRDGRIQKFIKANGSHADNPREAEYRAAIIGNYDMAEKLAAEKVALSQKMQVTMDKHLRYLDMQMKLLYDRNEPGFNDADEVPSLVRPSAANVATVPALRPSGPTTTSVLAGSHGRKEGPPSGAMRGPRGARANDEDSDDDAMDLDDEEAGDDRKYCLCNNVSFGDMVACDNPECPYECTWAVAHTADEAPAVVRVRNLQTTVAAAQDAWGRTGKPQPALVSVSVSLRSAFAAAAADDRLGADTVHYGNLSKAVLASLRGDANAPGCEDKVAEMSLRGVLETVWGQLTGQPVAGSRPGRGGGEGAGEGAGPGPGPGQAATEKPFLTLEKVRHLSVTVTLPKASLLGEGVSLTASAVFGNALEEGVVRLEAFGFALRLCNLRIPTLIGVNANERKAKQFVVANVEVDKFDHHPDIYTRLESMVVKTTESSEFETLEALGGKLAEDICSKTMHYTP
ncbi:hypothetical protein P8C59_007166 [Phyllachora maydis]|uniref:Inhibitor of growth protein N-terminal histone-binding domain-containing protein n=1 Tax=Phyllachora maydis TaxID=1825666 RepID=A0AAD9I869_9PEZI|nr:hypothetical protein P8C59_007166 [Phyllachora maydis]